MKNVITGFGNPLLDTTIYIPDDALLRKFDLKQNGEKEIPSEKMDELFEDISGFKRQTSAGGCSQNTFRVLQWFLKGQCETFIFGSVGDDEDAGNLKKLVEMDGVQTRYITQKNYRTGRVVSMVNGPNRSLVADIGAAQVLSLNDLMTSEEFSSIIKRSKWVYIEGYFLTNRWEAAQYIVNFCIKNEKPIIFNTCGEYIFEAVPDSIKYIVENSEIVIGNKEEFNALQKIFSCRNPLELIRKLHKCGQYIGTLLVITNGPQPVECVYMNGVVKRYKSDYILPTSEIIDTTGAGDAFAAGFIAGLCLSKDTSECVRYGCYCAANIIKVIGITIPDFDAKIPE